MSSSSENEQQAASSIIPLSSCLRLDRSAKQRRLWLETERIAQFELNQSSDTFFTLGFPHLIRYKYLLKQQRLKEGEKNNAGLYCFHHNFGRSHLFIRNHIHQEYTGHYYRINCGTSIINGRVTFPSSAQQVLETIKGKIYYKGKPVVLPEHKFINDLALQTVIITNLSEISSLPTTHIRSTQSTLSEISSLPTTPPTPIPTN